ncbi:conserved hypothetical protein, partial [Ricinus communis]
PTGPGYRAVAARAGRAHRAAHPAARPAGRLHRLRLPVDRGVPAAQSVGRIVGAGKRAAAVVMRASSFKEYAVRK